MSKYAIHIQNLTLYQELDKSVGRDALYDSDITILKGIVDSVAERIGPDLDRIRLTFPQYTEHDIKHSRNLIDLMGRFIPTETLSKLNALELSLLLLSALLHDTGMIISDFEKQQLLEEPDFITFCDRQSDKLNLYKKDKKLSNELRARAIEDGLIAEYLRRVHPDRSRNYIIRKLKKHLLFQEVDFSDDIATLCESHGWGVRESLDLCDPEKAVYKLRKKNPINGIPINLQYLACCLRLADIMDFDRTRTPASVFQQIEFSKEKSWKEWNRHLQVKGWTIDEREVAYSTSCTHPEFYVAVNEFIDSVDRELTDCRYLIDEASVKIAERYKLNLHHIVDRRQIKMSDKKYIAGDFRFQLEFEEIMKLLMDKSLYPDKSIFLRELLQNSLDACRHMEGLYRSNDIKKYKPRIVFWDKSDDVNDPRIVVQDNGVGMTLNIIKHFFVPIGKSYYRSMEFNSEREKLAKKGIQIDTCSYFGIGILSSFLVADRFDVETYRYGHEPLCVKIEGPNKCFVIERFKKPRCDFLTPQAKTDEEDGPPNISGTRVTVHLRDNLEIDVFQTLRTFATNVEYDIRLYRPGKKQVRIIRKNTWEPRAFSIRENICGDVTDFEVNDVLRGILVASHIPFKKWDFSKHLTGDAWFWFLRDVNGNPCPRRGFLTIDHRLHLCGSANVARHLITFFRLLNKEGFEDSYRRKWHSFAERNANITCDGFSSYLARSYEQLWSQKKLPDLKAFELKKSTEIFLRLDVQEKSKLLSLFRIAHFGNVLIPWVQIGEAWSKLYNGSLQWTSVSYTDLKAFKEVDEFADNLSITRFSLRGIFLPAGITKWRPLDGTSESLTNLMPMLGGISLDLRGKSSPIPTSNRFSIPLERATEFLSIFARASLRHAADLVETNDRENAWIQWFKESLIPIVQIRERLRRSRLESLICFIWQEAYRKEYSYIRDKIGSIPEIDRSLCL